MTTPQTSEVKKLKAPPTVPQIPWLGNYFDMRNAGIVDFLQNLAKKYGDVAHFTLFGNEIYLVSHPDLIEQVLVRDNAGFEKDKALKLLKRYALGNSLLTSEGDEHKQQRKQSSKAFSRKNINGYAEAMTEITREHVRAWRDGDEKEIHQEMMAITAKIAAVTLFNSGIDEKVLRIGKAIADILALTDYMVSPIAEIIMALPTPITRNLGRALKELDAIIYDFIDEHLRTGRSKHFAGQEVPPGEMLKGIEKPDFLSNIIEAKKEQGIDLTTPANRKQLRDEALTIFLAGHETTANALTWTWVLLGQHAAESERMRAEIDSALAAGALDAERVNTLEYTRRVFTEAMRLYPPAWAVGRYVKQDYDLGGYLIPKGSEIWMSQYVVHRDARWHDDPTSFRPDRWLPENEGNRPRMSYFPFSAGPRNCIGEQFAWLEGALVLAEISHRFDLKLHPDQKFDVLPQVTLRPRYPIKVRIKSIQSNL